MNELNTGILTRGTRNAQRLTQVVLGSHLVVLGHAKSRLGGRYYYVQ